MSTATKAPVFFISHGENEEKPGRFYDWFGSLIQKRLAPKAIVIITAHWQPQEEETILGSPALAHRVVGLLEKAGIRASERQYGNDHGVWVPLKRAMTSCSTIPIVAVSTFLDDHLAPHVKVGEALESLRDENIVIIGSGSAVHNLEGWRTFGEKPSPDYPTGFIIDLTVFNREKNVSRKRWDWISMLIIVIAIRRLSIWFPSL
ncbi:hypothetical protein RO3G_13779 [Rhizopus delemar RA 99-880]|uniref:Extradiol ring-cleavage dioxygenase class III enzyme subunit B domain-containing protein n=1 Tax=Rhizopus delemar (strain RA 99-880 / ATCC MYA-4621 / FGSC 9543 / NRRL 43880) TaxID=246409 RepID=I1CKT8_RHIO9|nr:hypothetical protein RO3G_13779 [Rhizopus delemar RA 99-880]|eukprot:EIE89068.1 hypothetical protein RO3G_13779 [Rhizopus delemar RA 99-880]